MRPIFVEVSTLFEPAWSGIANVTANLCRSLLRGNQDVDFFAYDKLLARSYVKNSLLNSDGMGLRLTFEYGQAVERPLSTRDRHENEVGIFPNFKRASQDFSMEVLIVHDLSFVLTPELHEPHLVSDYVEKIYRDAHTVDRCICVSEATKDDLVRYYAVPKCKVSVAHLGMDRPPLSLELNKTELDLLNELHLKPGTFFLVLGTIEPRKNVGLVLDYIKMHPEFLDSHMLVFAGRDGWGKPFSQLLNERNISDPRVIHLGYVFEPLRQALLRHCKALIFPSLFEGFGLPIIEAMSWGIPVIGSCSSSMVEVGGKVMMSFDPCSVESFADTVHRFLKLEKIKLQELKVESRKWANGFTWDRFRDCILACIDGNAKAEVPNVATFDSLEVVIPSRLPRPCRSVPERKSVSN
jgi:glycosyltransferase involved in cell wall biosynthesis